jgi:ABC-type glutathione transport system ATPase component
MDFLKTENAADEMNARLKVMLVKTMSGRFQYSSIPASGSSIPTAAATSPYGENGSVSSTSSLPTSRGGVKQLWRKSTGDRRSVTGRQLIAGGTQRLPYLYVSMSWKNICQHYPTTTPDIKAVSNSSGNAIPGHITAVLGVCGSGKTTLLDTLHGGVVQPNQAGQIFVNKVQVTRPSSRFTGYFTSFL